LPSREGGEILNIEEVRQRLGAASEMLAADGYRLHVARSEPAGEQGSIVQVVIEATPEACADCLMPKATMVQILEHMLGDMDDRPRLDLTYPVEGS